MALEQGGQIPDLALTASDGGSLRLREFLGQPLVVYFYPKDDTPGCTKQAQDFSAHQADFAALGVKLLGISKDTPAKHRKFIEKYALSVPLASDDDNAVLEAFGAWVEKSMYGKSYMGIDRSTFLFDKNGTLVRVWRKVKVPGHVADVLAAARALTE